MDLYDGEIIAHCIVRRPVLELVSGTLRAALSRFECNAELTAYSDQGWQYEMHPYRPLLAHFDNAMIENCDHEYVKLGLQGLSPAEYRLKKPA